MKFIVDAQLPAAIAGALTVAGHQAEAARDAGLREAEDGVIWDYADMHQLVINTKDEDFSERVLRSPTGPAVIWLRIGNCSNQALLEWLMPLLPDIIERLNFGDRLVEVS